MKKACVLAALWAVGLMGTTAPTASAHAAGADGVDELRMVVVLSRHGVRSPTSDGASLGAFSEQPWPQWNVAPGYLTPHGKQLMGIMGGWYRAYYSHEGLVSAQGCQEAGATYVVADDEERTLESAHGLMDGFLPGCEVVVHADPKDGKEALFSHASIAATDGDRATALAAVLGRIGGDPVYLAQAHAGALATMQSVLLGCAPGLCSASQTRGKKVLFDQESAIDAGKGDALVSIKSPLHNASTFAENFVLEYTEGMPMSQVAWGRVSPLQIGQLLELHTAYSDIALRTAPIARLYAGKLATAILATLQQGSSGKPADKAVGGAGAHMVFLVGHDTNITTLAGMLGLHWMMAEQPTDPTSTGGALVFELHRNRSTGGEHVRLYYVSQTMEQMRHSTPLSLHSPPQRVPVRVPGCNGSTSDEGCTLSQFEVAVAHALAGNPQAD
jgi:4-phytase/acid phosphatase